jgi:putative FmdB family regulatory protein
MPTYDLACRDCTSQFERFRQGFLRDEDRMCPQCGSSQVQQRFTGFVTARPSKGDGGPSSVKSFGGGCCGGACGCG